MCVESGFWKVVAQFLTNDTRPQFIVMPAKAGTQSLPLAWTGGQPALRLRPWTPAFAGATEKRGSEPIVWFIPLGVTQAAWTWLAVIDF